MSHTVRMPLSRLLPLLVLLVLCLPARAGQPLNLEQARIRLLPPPLPLAGYFVLHNQGPEAVTLVGAQSPAFARVMIHQAVTREGTASMRPVTELELPAGGRVSFAPGGYHLMLMQRQRALEPGEQVPVTLVFADGQRLEAAFTVQRPTAE